MLKKILPFLMVIHLSSFYCQKDTLYNFVRNTEAELQALQRKTFYSRLEADRFEGNREFLQIWDRIVPFAQTLTYKFNLPEVSILTAPDESFRLITWNVPKDDGTHVYFGYLLSQNTITRRTGLFQKETTQEYNSFKLLDRSATVRSPENYSGTSDKWFGMLYTELIPCDGYYTLLGWDGNNKLTQRKFVDVLYFRGAGIPVFGKDVFRIPRKNPRRLMFEYSSEVTMSLKYDRNKHRIIYSHLSSHQEGALLEGQHQYYGPDGSYDALVMRKGRWEVEEDIDARNEKNKNDNAPKPDPSKQRPIYVPK